MMYSQKNVLVLSHGEVYEAEMVSRHGPWPGRCLSRQSSHHTFPTVALSSPNT